MIRWVIVFLLLGTVAHGRFMSGSDKDNGGFIVYCGHPSGYYSTDFILSQRELTELKLIRPRSLESSLDHVERGLERHLSRFLPSFKRFREQLFRSSAMLESGGYSWERDQQSLEVIKADALALRRQLPRSCSGKIEQVVRREKLYGATVFHFDHQDIERLRVRPLQLSFLLVHEWLWGITKDPDSLRRLNKVLHSNSFVSFSSDQAENLLWNIGLQTQCEIPVDLLTHSTRTVSCNDILGAGNVSREVVQMCLTQRSRFQKCIQLAGFYQSKEDEVKVCLRSTYFNISLDYCLKAFHTSKHQSAFHLTVGEVRQCGARIFGTPHGFKACLNKKLRTN